MQNVMIWVQSGSGGYKFRYKGTDIAHNYIRLQIENSLMLGWEKEDIVLITNFPFDYMGVAAHNVQSICKWSAFANKLVFTNEMIKMGVINDNFWMHDVDAFQLVPFDFPTECKDIGYARHAPGRSKPQGGSAFYRKEAFDVVEAAAKGIRIFKAPKEESFLPMLYSKLDGKTSKIKMQGKVDRIQLQVDANPKSARLQNKLVFYKGCRDYGLENFAKFASRFSWLNFTYNLSQQRMFPKKYPKTTKPVKVVHFHTEYPSTMNCFYYGHNAYKVPIVTDALEELMIKHHLIDAEKRR